MTPLEKSKLEFYRSRIGQMTSAEALDLAMMDDKMARDCGPMDIAYDHFARSSHQMLNYAELLEKEEQEVRHEPAVR